MSTASRFTRVKNWLSHSARRLSSVLGMERLLREQVAKIQVMVKTEVPWQLDQPWPQPYYKYTGGQWSAVDASATQDVVPTRGLALYSWNIDFMLPFPKSRMQKAIEHLKSLVASHSTDTATIIFLQESLQSDLHLLSSTPWVQETFFLSDLDTSNWSSGYYGTVTLVDKRVKIKSSFRVHYSQTKMERDVFFTDVDLGSPGQVIRLCNTHLESLALDPPRRPDQVKICAQYMHDDGVFGAAMAGDFNAIQDFDRQLHADHELKDAYLELGGLEDSDDGYTWGQQAATYQRNMFGCSRMDKVFFCGGLTLKSFDRFGAGIEVDDEAEKTHLVQLGFDQPWITDHLGIRAHFEVAEAEEPPSKLLTESVL